MYKSKFIFFDREAKGFLDNVMLLAKNTATMRMRITYSILI